MGLSRFWSRLDTAGIWTACNKWAWSHHDSLYCYLQSLQACERAWIAHPNPNFCWSRKLCAPIGWRSCQIGFIDEHGAPPSWKTHGPSMCHGPLGACSCSSQVPTAPLGLPPSSPSLVLLQPASLQPKSTTYASHVNESGQTNQTGLVPCSFLSGRPLARTKLYV
jgi:hypothetical protein